MNLGLEARAQLEHFRLAELREPAWLLRFLEARLTNGQILALPLHLDKRRLLLLLLRKRLSRLRRRRRLLRLLLRLLDLLSLRVLLLVPLNLLRLELLRLRWRLRLLLCLLRLALRISMLPLAFFLINPPRRKTRFDTTSRKTGPTPPHRAARPPRRTATPHEQPRAVALLPSQALLIAKRRRAFAAPR